MVGSRSQPEPHLRDNGYPAPCEERLRSETHAHRHPQAVVVVPVVRVVVARGRTRVHSQGAS